MAMMKLSQGEKAILTIPASLAYGTKGYGKLGGVTSKTWGKKHGDFWNGDEHDATWSIFIHVRLYSTSQQLR